MNFTPENAFRVYTAPPQQGGTPTGATAPSNWFAARRNFEVHYQLRVRDQYLDVQGLSPFTNIARITVGTSPGDCAYENTATVTYVPKPLNKVIHLDGSDLAHVEIEINPDGGHAFSAPGLPPPAEIIAKDELDNMMVYMDSIKVYTETKVGGTWNGVWTPQPITFNDRTLWSANVVSMAEIDFVIPNSTPVKIEYDALLLIPEGDMGTIGNKISILGESVTDGASNYQVSDSKAGGGGSLLPVKAFKQDNVGNVLTVATFNLYVTALNDYSAPVGLEGAPTISFTGPDGVNRNFYQLIGDTVTDSHGMAFLSNNWITATHEFIFLLVETQAPYNYVQPTGLDSYTFFTVNPKIIPSRLRAQEVLLDIPLGKINQVSDFVTVTNFPIPGTPRNSMRVRKEFHGLSELQIQQNMQNFRIEITGPAGFSRTINLSDALAGVNFPIVQDGTYFFTEVNANMPGYDFRSIPQLPFRRYVIPNDMGAVTFLIANEYNQGEKSPQTGVERNFIIPTALLSLGIICLAGAEVVRRRNHKSKE